MQLSVEHKNAAIVVAPAGRIDHASADPFAAALQPHLDRCTADGPALVVDMHAVDYISSVGLRVFMVAAKQAEAQGGRIALARLMPLVREVFSISRFDTVLDVHDRLEDALAATGAGG